jgi:hypothetical protein
VPLFSPVSAASAPVSGYQDFTSNGTFTMPSGKSYVQAIVIGGGGGGSGAYAGMGTGGNGGFVNVTPFIALSAGSTCAITVGGGGAAGTDRNYGQYGSSATPFGAPTLGGSGSSSSIVISGTTYSAAGGNGGQDTGYGLGSSFAAVRSFATSGAYSSRTVYGNPQAFLVSALSAYVSAGGYGRGGISNNSADGYSAPGSSSGAGASALASGQATANASSSGCGGGGGENSGSGASGIVRVYYI